MRSKTERPTGPMMMVMMFVVALVAASCGGGDAVADEDWHALLVEDGLTSSQADCVIADLAEIGLSPGDITDEALGDDEVPEAAVDVLFDCIMGRDASSLLDGVDVPDTEIDLGEIGGDVDLAQVQSDFARFADDTTSGAYGDDASLDALWDECEAGDARSCDQLFWSSPIGSTYEAFGMTCGGRFEGSMQSCVSRVG